MAATKKSEEKSLDDVLVEFQQLRNLVGALRMDFKEFHRGHDLPESVAKTLAFLETKVEGCLQKIVSMSEEMEIVKEFAKQVEKEALFVSKKAIRLEGQMDTLWAKFTEISKRVATLEGEQN